MRFPDPSTSRLALPLANSPGGSSSSGVINAEVSFFRLRPRRFSVDGEGSAAGDETRDLSEFGLRPRFFPEYTFEAVDGPAGVVVILTLAGLPRFLGVTVAGESLSTWEALTSSPPSSS